MDYVDSLNALNLILAAVSFVALVLIYHKTKLQSAILLAMAAVWLVGVRLGIMWGGSWIDENSQWLVFPVNVLRAAGFIWLCLSVYKWYGGRP